MSDESFGSPDVSLAQTHHDPPRLRIHHLMACAAVAAVQLSIWRASYSHSASQQPAFYMGTTAIRLVLGSIGLTLALFLLYWRFSARLAINQPGQWLLIAFILYAIQNWLNALWWYSMGFDTAAGVMRPPGGRSEWWLLLDVLMFVVVYIFSFAFYCWCTVKGTDTLPWRLLFLAFAIAPIFTSGWAIQAIIPEFGVRSQNIFVIFYGLRGTVFIVLEIAAVLSDYAARRARNWTHWVGVGISMAMQLLSVLVTVLQWLQSP